MSNPKTLVLIDGHAHLFQSFYAIQELNDPQGRPVNAIYGVLNMLLRIIEKFDSSHLACVFDSPGPTFRHEIYSDYKANRGEMDEALREQIPRLQNLLRLMKFPVLAQEGYECDDIIGTLASQAGQQGFKTILVSEDKDFGQLINDQVIQYKNRKDILVDAEALKDSLGVRPDQVIDYLALVGDASDNVPGVTGIGPKTAATLLNAYDTAKNLYDHLDDIKGKKHENLKQDQETFELAQELVTIKTDVPLDTTLDDLKRQSWDNAEVITAFQELGFKRFIERLKLDSGESSPLQSASSTITRHYQIIRSIKELKKLIKDLKNVDMLAIDTETTGLNPHEDLIVGLSLAWAPGQAAYIPLRAPEGALPLEEASGLLAPFLKRNQTTWIGHNLKFDAAVLQAADLPLGPQWEDTLLLTFALDSGNRRLKLDDLAWDCLGEKMIPIKDLIGSGKKMRTMDTIPLEEVGPYAAEDADMTWRLYHYLSQPISSDDRRLEKYRQQEIPLSRLLLSMETQGVKLDTAYLEKLSQEMASELATLETQIHDLAGHPFNIASPKQLGVVLFEELNLPVIRKTKTGYSTDSKVLAQLAAHHEIPGLVEEHRQLSKLKNTYIDALPELCNSQGILHTTYSQTAAITGRLASQRPNLQNIPIRNPRARAIRGAFTPRSHDTFLSADYSQIELRLMAHFSQDPELCQAFSEGMDIHAFVASQVNDIALSEVTDDMRAAAKAVNFGILYGQGAFGLSQQLNITQKEAKEFIENYFDRFETIRDFVSQTIEQARQDGFVETLEGHRRPILELQSSNKMLQKMGERIAVNTLMQGSAADLIKTAMLRVEKWLSENPLQAQMVLQIHDELLFDVAEKDIPPLKEALLPLMTENMNLSIPLEISVHTGHTWLEAK